MNTNNGPTVGSRSCVEGHPNSTISNLITHTPPKGMTMSAENNTPSFKSTPITTAMNKATIKNWIKSYTKDFATRWEKQNYKWEAVESARKHWDIDSPHLLLCFEASAKALSKNRRLLRPFGERMAYGMLQQFITHEETAIREALRSLLTENNREQVEERMADFLAEADEIKERRRTRDLPNWSKHFQTKATTSALLWLLHPETFYYTEPEWAANALKELGFIYTGSMRTLNYVEVLPCFDCVRDELNKEEYGLKEMLRRYLVTERHYTDDELSLLTNDFMEYVGREVKKRKA